MEYFGELLYQYGDKQHVTVTLHKTVRVNIITALCGTLKAFFEPHRHWTVSEWSEWSPRI